MNGYYNPYQTYYNTLNSFVGDKNVSTRFEKGVDKGEGRVNFHFLNLFKY